MDGGYEYNFVEAPDELVCMVCHHIAREAHQMECCGKVFCKTCIKDDRVSSCPNCREPSPKVFRDLRSSRDIKRLRVVCENEEKGCEWSGTLEEYEKHKNECDCEEVKCFNWPWCEQKIQKRHLSQHIATVCCGRKKECQVCHNQIVHILMPLHPITCPKVEVECTNLGCSAKILREQLDTHRSICPKQRICCPYENSGCDAVVLREDRQKHLEENIEQHSIIANNTILELRQGLLDSRKQLKEANNALESRCVPPMTFKVSNYTQLKEGREAWWSPPLYTHKGGYKMKIIVKPNRENDHLAVRIQIVLGPNDDKLVWPFAGTVTFQLLNQAHDYGHQIMTCSWIDASEKSTRKPIVGESNNSRGTSKFISFSELELERDNGMTTYLKDDCIYIRISEVSVASQCKPWLVCSPSVQES